MSHLKEYVTTIRNLEYLKKALNRLAVSYHVSGQNIILPQADDQNASFCWNGKSYTLFYDMDFWTNSLTVNSFTENITREYSTEKVIDNMEKFGFRTECYKDCMQQNNYKTVKAKDLILSRYSF